MADPAPALTVDGIVANTIDPKCPPGSALRGGVIVYEKATSCCAWISIFSGVTFTQDDIENGVLSDVKSTPPSSPWAVKFFTVACIATTLSVVFLRKIVPFEGVPGVKLISRLDGWTTSAGGFVCALIRLTPIIIPMMITTDNNRGRCSSFLPFMSISWSCRIGYHI